jgi:hypothetical protein
MAKSSVITLTVAVTGDGVNELYNISSISPMINAAAPAGGPLTYALISGDNTIVAPPGAQGMIIVPPLTSTSVKKLKGVSGDTGFAISTTLPTMVSLPAGTTSVLLNGTVGENVTIHWV